MKKKVMVSMPVNLNNDDKPFFKTRSNYTTPLLKLKKINGPLVTSSGLVCTSAGLVKECCHYKMGSELQLCTMQVSHYFSAAKSDSNNLITLDDEETYLLIHHPWFFNYYHWVCESLVRLLMIRDKTSDMILLLPSNPPKYIIDSLEPFNFKGVFYIPLGKSVLVRLLCMPQICPEMAVYNPFDLRELNKIYTDYVSSAKKITLKIGERLYLSRSKSKKRTISNEDAVINILKEYNFKVIYNEDYTFFEQVSLYSQAKFLISIHGAGLSNLLFMPQGTTVFEFHKKPTNPSDRHNLVYWYMSDALNHKYYHQVCDHTTFNSQFFSEDIADITVDIQSFKNDLDKIFFANQNIA